jgi:hypothetical protein
VIDSKRLERAGADLTLAIRDATISWKCRGIREREINDALHGRRHACALTLSPGSNIANEHGSRT